MKLEEQEQFIDSLESSAKRWQRGSLICYILAALSVTAAGSWVIWMQSSGPWVIALFIALYVGFFVLARIFQNKSLRITEDILLGKAMLEYQKTLSKVKVNKKVSAQHPVFSKCVVPHVEE